MTFGQLCMAKMIAEKKARGSLSPDEGASIIDALDAERAVMSKKAPRVASTNGRRARNVLFDTLATETGCRDLSQITRAGARAIAVALADIREVSPDLTPEEISRRASAYRSKHRDWPLTAPALAKYWSEFGGNRTRSAKRDVYVEPAEWDRVAETLWGQQVASKMAGLGWSEISTALRADILREMAKVSV